MRVRLWLKSTRISVATCQKERIVRRYFSLHWGAGSMPRKETWHGHEERSASCNNTLRRFQRHGRSKSRPYKNPHNHHGNFVIVQVYLCHLACSRRFHFGTNNSQSKRNNAA